MFDSMVEGILLYGSKVWGFEDMYLIEQVHLKFCKRILRVRNTTAKFMVYGELGRFPLELRVKLRIISFWAELVQSEGKLCNLLYCLLFCLQSKGNHSFKWIEYIKKTWNELGMSYMYTNQFSFFNVKSIQFTLQYQYIQKWFSDIFASSRGEFYSIFKKSFGIENYVLRLPESCRIWITKMRTSNLHLPIETGRWANIPRQDRICTLCNENIGDEFHILFRCKNQNIITLREKKLPIYYYKIGWFAVIL